MGLNAFKLTVILSLGALMVTYNNCGSPFGSPSPLFFESNVYGGSSSVSYDAFERTVYTITRSQCVSCHDTQQPTHASDDVKQAHDAVIGNFKVNFADIPSSRLVKKLREDNHNCWGDCEENALEMERAITEWNDAIKESGVPAEETPVDTKVYTAQSLALSEEFALAQNAARANVISLNMEAAMLKPPMVKMTDGSSTYVTVPNSLNNTLAANEVNAGTASLNFRVRQNGTYRIWGLVDAPNTSDNGFYLHLTTTNTGVKEWEIPVTNGFEWRQLTNNTFSLSNNATHNLEIRQRKDGTKIKQVVITSDNSFNANTAPDLTAITLTYDLSEQLRVPGITFKVDVIDYDLYSYKFQNPRIETSAVNVRARDVKLLVNGSYNPQHSTFTLIDKLVTPQDTRLSTYAMLVIKDKGLNVDKISFAFEELKLDYGNMDDPALVASQDSFRQNFWPISRTNCISCHTVQNPPHAHDDYKEAHDVVVTQNLVNFTTPSNSRIVSKVRGRHNCGTQTQCDAIANQFQNAIIEWKKSRP